MDAGRFPGGISLPAVPRAELQNCQSLPALRARCTKGHRRETFCPLGIPAAFGQSRRGEQPFVLALCPYGKGLHHLPETRIGPDLLTKY